MKAEKTRKLIARMIRELAEFGAQSSINGQVELELDAFEELTRIEEYAAKGLRAEQAEREIEAEIKSHTERGDYADRKGDTEESQRLWDMVAGLYIALDKVTGEGADRLKGVVT